MLEELTFANEYIINKIDRFVEYTDLLKELENYALANNVPIISKEAACFLEFLIMSNSNIKNILEIGTAIGYSGIKMLSCVKDRNISLTTIEIDDIRYNLAKANFIKANLSDNVTQILGDATEKIPKINEKFDFIFIDAAKGQYKKFFEDSYKLLNDGGIIFIDNIMFRGYIYKYIPKKFRTIVKRLDEFIDYLYENYNFVLLPFADGIGLVYKNTDIKHNK